MSEENEAAQTVEKKPKTNSARRREAAAARKSEGAGVATAKWMRFSARKGRLIADMIRGLPAPRALAVLRETRRKAAAAALKLLKSALANANDTKKLEAQDLVVKAVMVDEGPTMKRVRPRARGRADRIDKRTCHATIIVDERS